MSDEAAPISRSARHSDVRAKIFLFRRNRPLIRVLLAGDHEIVRACSRRMLESAPDIRVVAEAGDGEACCAGYRRYAPDVVLLDLNMRGVCGIETTRRIKAHDANARILVFSSHTGAARIQRVLAAGAAGYLDKRDFPQLVEAVRGVARRATDIAGILAARPYPINPDNLPINEITGGDNCRCAAVAGQKNGLALPTYS